MRYKLQRGVITFDDPNQTHPVLNVSVNTTIEQYNLTLTMRGPLDKLTTEYTSDPPLATADVINLVARGKTTGEQAASSQSTDSMIASQVAGQLSSGIQKLAGISSLQIDPTLGGNNSNPSARIAIQQRVTKNLLFSFSTDVSQPGSEIVQGEYQINKRWSVSLAARSGGRNFRRREISHALLAALRKRSSQLPRRPACSRSALARIRPGVPAAGPPRLFRSVDCESKAAECLREEMGDRTEFVRAPPAS